jgi:hypothetical protein
VVSVVIRRLCLDRSISRYFPVSLLISPAGSLCR